MNNEPVPEIRLPTDAAETGQESYSISAVDLFCGIGGLTHGLLQADIKVNAGIDIDKTCRYAYQQNNAAQFIAKDIRCINSTQLSELYPANDIKLLVGCAPCQPFSPHTRKNRNRNSDARWGLLAHFQKLVEGVTPEIIAVENVPSIRRQKVFTDFVDKLQELGYLVYQELVYCPDYGIPQTRRRLVLMASLFGDIALLPKTHARSHCHSAGAALGDLPGQQHTALKALKTVRATIGDLPAIADGQVSGEDPLHRTRTLSLLNKERMKQSKPGGTWLDWDVDLRAPCHKKESGQTYKSVYARMKWDEPAPTITTQFCNFGTGRFGHPEQHRALSLREGALLQTFPQSYDFIDPNLPVSIQRLGIHIGNAIPVQLATVIGQSIQRHLEDLRRG